MIKEYLESLDELEAWRGLKSTDPVFRSRRRVSLALAVLVGVVHISLPGLIRAVQSWYTGVPFLSSPRFALAELVGNSVFAAAMSYFLYEAQKAILHYRHSCHKFGLLLAMWHLPSLHAVLKTFSLDDASSGERRRFFEVYRFFDMLGSDARRCINAWWFARDFVTLQFNDLRLAMEGILMQCVFFLAIIIAWVFFKIYQQDYSAAQVINWVALWDICALACLAISGGFQVCVQMNNLLRQEFINVIEVRQQNFMSSTRAADRKFSSDLCEQGGGPGERVQFPAEVQTVPRIGSDDSHCQQATVALPNLLIRAREANETSPSHCAFQAHAKGMGSRRVLHRMGSALRLVRTPAIPEERSFAWRPHEHSESEPPEVDRHDAATEKLMGLVEEVKRAQRDLHKTLDLAFFGVRQLRNGDYLDAIVSKLECTEMRQTLLGMTVDRRLQMKVVGLVSTSLSSLLFRVLGRLLQDPS